MVHRHKLRGKVSAMPSVTTSYVSFGTSESHTRQPRTITSYGGFTPIPGWNPGPGGTYPSGTVSPGNAPTIDGYHFAFVNVSGGDNGPVTSFSADPQPPLSVPIGGQGGQPNVVVLFVYVPVGNSNGNGSGAVIDAFDATQNVLLDNDFVTVSPDPGGTLTTEANVDGWVNTTDSGYTITADHPNIGPYEALPTTALFQFWSDLLNPSPPTSLISVANLTPAKGETVYALAFYTDPGPKKLPPKIHFEPWEKPPGDEKTPYPHSEVPSPLEPGGDPGEIAGQISTLQQRLGQSEADLKSTGSAFIKPEDRPAAGQ